MLFLEGCPDAAYQVRNGSGINPMMLTNLTLPVLGETWIAEIDCAGHAPSVCALVGGDMPVSGYVIGIGEILVDFISGTEYFFTILPHNTDVRTFSYPLPLDTAFAGVPIYTQGLVLGDPGGNFLNGIDLLLGK